MLKCMWNYICFGQCCCCFSFSHNCHKTWDRKNKSLSLMYFPGFQRKDILYIWDSVVAERIKVLSRAIRKRPEPCEEVVGTSNNSRGLSRKRHLWAPSQKFLIVLSGLGFASLCLSPCLFPPFSSLPPSYISGEGRAIGKKHFLFLFQCLHRAHYT